MHAYEIYEKYTSLKTDKAKDALLKNHRDNKDFWYTVGLVLDPLRKVNGIVLGDQGEAGDGVPDGIFEKIIGRFQSKELDETSFIYAIRKFSQHCTPDEWAWYQRCIVESGEQSLDISIRAFNKHAGDYAVPRMPIPPLIEVRPDTQIPKIIYVEPWVAKGIRKFIHIASDLSITEYNDDRTVTEDWSYIIAEAISRNGEFQLPQSNAIILEVIDSGSFIEFRDLYLVSGDLLPYAIPFPKRRDLLISFYSTYFEEAIQNSALVECIEVSGSPRDDIAILFEQGCDGVVLRDQNSFSTGGYTILPDRRVTLTCTGTEIGSEGRYRGQIVYLHGKGVITVEGQRTAFETPVFHGLKHSDRQVKDDGTHLLGNKFVVRTVGLGQDGRLLFPVFEGWK